MSRMTLRPLLPLLLIVLISSAGCQQMFSWRQAKLKALPAASADHPVYEVICLWEPGEGTGMDGLPSRGFVGKIMFFAHGIDPPVRVDGDMKIYVFDDQGSPEDQEKPVHQFNFDSNAFQNFLVESNLGAAYQLFIPYTRQGIHRANCSIRVKLTTQDAKPVYSKMGSVILPGKVARQPEKPVTEVPPQRNDGIRLVSHEEPEFSTGRSHEVSSIPASSSGESDKARLLSVLNQSTQNKGLQPSPQPPTLQPLPPRTHETDAVPVATDGAPSQLRLKAVSRPETPPTERKATASSPSSQHPLDQLSPTAPSQAAPAASDSAPESSPPPAAAHPLLDP